MRRRGFLTVSALGTVAVGCGGTLARPTLGTTEARELAARLERGMQMLSDRPVGSLVQGPPASRPDLREQLLRLTLESMLVLDVLRAVPEGASIPPELGEVLAPRLPRLDRAIRTHHALLSRMPRERQQELDRRVRAQPNTAMDVAAWLDERAAEVGVPADNRMRLRHSAMSVGTRLRRQSTNAVVTDCVAKLDEAFAQSLPLAPDLAERTARVVDVLWRQVGQSSDWGAPAAVAPPQASASADRFSPWPDPLLAPEALGAQREMFEPTEPVQWNDSWASPGDEEIRLGAIMMPLGLVTCGILLIVGLVVAIAGVVQNDAWDGRSHADDATVI